MTEREKLKRAHLKTLSVYTRGLYSRPELRRLFLEMTLRCNEHCFHCGSNCGDVPSDELSADEFKRVIDTVAEDFDPRRVMLCVTGGEPTLRRDLCDIMGYASSLGFSWGMTSNATLITREKAEDLADAGMKTISVSIDGLRETHDELRASPGSFDRAMRGVENLISAGRFEDVQITTVFNHRNIAELDDLFDLMDGVDIDSWRVATLEPIGRALSRPELMCTAEDYRRLFDFIKKKREEGFPIEYGCTHWLGLDHEAEVRDWYWQCSCGIYTASIMCNGDIGGCLDVERRPETVFGNVKKDRFSDVWRDGFAIYRRDHSLDCEKCRACPDAEFCRGDARHSWDYDKNEPMVCLKKTLEL